MFSPLLLIRICTNVSRVACAGREERLTVPLRSCSHTWEQYQIHLIFAAASSTPQRPTLPAAAPGP